MLITNLNNYPFGMIMPGRSYTSQSFRYGFNGHEKDDVVKGSGNHLSFGDYGYDSRLGRRLNIDPAHQDVPGISPYAFSFNSPLMFNDENGKKAKVSIQRGDNGGGVITISSTIYVSGLPKDNADVFINKLTQEAKTLLKSGTYVDIEGNSWQIVYDINFKSGEIGNSKEDKYFNNQLTVNATKNQASPFTGEGFITETTVKGVVKDNREKIGTALEESIHFLGLGDQYDKVVEGFIPKEIGFIAKNGFEKDVLTGPVRLNDFEFSGEHSKAIGSYLENQGLLLNNNQTNTSVINTRINGGIQTQKKENLSPEKQKKVVKKF